MLSPTAANGTMRLPRDPSIHSQGMQSDWSSGGPPVDCRRRPNTMSSVNYISLRIPSTQNQARVLKAC